MSFETHQQFKVITTVKFGFVYMLKYTYPILLVNQVANDQRPMGAVSAAQTRSMIEVRIVTASLQSSRVSFVCVVKDKCGSSTTDNRLCISFPISARDAEHSHAKKKKGARPTRRVFFAL